MSGEVHTVANGFVFIFRLGHGLFWWIVLAKFKQCQSALPRQQSKGLFCG